MGLFDRFRRSGNAEDVPSAPRPDEDGERDEVTFERTRYEATVHYRNGETETFECYGIYSRGEHQVTFNTDPYARMDYFDGPKYSYRRRSINYETLAREPTLDEIATDEFVVSYTRNFEWKSLRSVTRGREKQWVEEKTDLELTINKDIA